MLINLNKVFDRDENEKQLGFELDFSSETENWDAQFLSPVNVVLNLARQNNQISIKLVLKGNASCVCGRCLKLFFKEFNVNEEFVVTPATLTQQDPEIPINSDYTLDVKQLAMQELSLDIPTVLICSEDCLGLCAFCGKPKEENCNCQSKQIDPRLMALKQLLDELEENDDN